MAADAEYVNGWLKVRENRVEEAVRHLKKCLSLADKLGIKKLSAWATVELAQCARANCDHLNELELLQRAYRLGGKSKDYVLELYILCSISTLYNEITDLSASCAYVGKAIAKLKTIKQNMRITGGLSGSVNALESQLMVRYAIVCYRCGRHDETAALAEQVRAGPPRSYPVNPRKALIPDRVARPVRAWRKRQSPGICRAGTGRRGGIRERAVLRAGIPTYRLMNHLLGWAGLAKP
jgi:tetratricopeptide (TPR) repeat protein